MTVLRSPTPRIKELTNAGAPAAGYKIYTYAAGTTTPLSTYQDRAGLVANTNPIILDARGEAVAYLLAGRVYDFVLKTDTDALVRTDEDVTADAGDSAAVTFNAGGTGAVDRTVEAKLQEAASILDYIPVAEHAAIVAGTSTYDCTDDFNNALAEHKRLYVPAGRYTVTDMITMQNGAELYGDDRTLSVIYAPETFNLSALGVLRIGTAESGGRVVDIGFNFEQDNTSATRAACTQYPPAIYAVDVPRFQIDRVRISNAWDGIDATGNSGGSWIGRLEVCALNVGLDIDGSLDFFHIDSYHFWPFGINTASSLYTAVYSDGTTIGIRLGVCDGFCADKVSLFKCLLVCTGTVGATGSRNIASLQLDTDGARIVHQGRDLQIGTVYSSKNAATLPTIDMSGGRLFIDNWHDSQAGAANTITVTGGILQINSGYLRQLSVGSRAALVSGGQLELRNMYWEVPASARVVAYVEQSGAGILVCEGNTVQNSAASGTLVTYANDNLGHVCANNSFGAWTLTLPSDARLGMYGPNHLNGQSFTPTVSFATNGDFSPTYAVQIGRLWRTNAGTFFKARVLFNCNAYTTASGVFQMGGLPYSVVGGIDQGSLELSHWSKITLTASMTQLGACLNTTSHLINFRQSGSGQNAAVLSNTNIPASTTNVELVLAGFIPAR